MDRKILDRMASDEDVFFDTVFEYINSHIGDYFMAFLSKFLNAGAITEIDVKNFNGRLSRVPIIRGDSTSKEPAKPKKETPDPANTVAACDDTAKAKDSDKEEVTNANATEKLKEMASSVQAAIEGNKKWWRKQLDGIEFTRVEFDKAKAKQTEKSEAPCDLQCAASFCKDIFEKKFGLYGASFCDMHPETVTDQLYMKATILKKQLTDRDKGKRFGLAFFEGMRDEFAAVVNYGIIALRQGGFGVPALEVPESPMQFYSDQMQAALKLISEKGTEYGELWRKQRIGTFADMIEVKIRRLKGIEDRYRIGGLTKEDYHKFAEDQYKDMINYGLFGIVQLTAIIEYEKQMEGYARFV